MLTFRQAQFLRFLIRWEGGTTSNPGESVAEAYERAAPKAFSDDPADAGGATMMGVTMPVFRLWRQGICRRTEPTTDDLRAMTYPEWEDIVRHFYWASIMGDTLTHDCVAIALADWLWHSGHIAVRTLQRLVGVEADGVFGRVTLNAVKRCCGTRAAARQLATDLIECRRDVLNRLVERRPANRRFIRGWENRLQALEALIPDLDLNDAERRSKRTTL